MLESIGWSLIVVFGILVLFICLGDPAPSRKGRAPSSRAHRYLHDANSITAKEE